LKRLESAGFVLFEAETLVQKGIKVDWFEEGGNPSPLERRKDRVHLNEITQKGESAGHGANIGRPHKKGTFA